MEKRFVRTYSRKQPVISFESGSKLVPKCEIRTSKIRESRLNEKTLIVDPFNDTFDRVAHSNVNYENLIVNKFEDTFDRIARTDAKNDTIDSNSFVFKIPQKTEQQYKKKQKEINNGFFDKDIQKEKENANGFYNKKNKGKRKKFASESSDEDFNMTPPQVNQYDNPEKVSEMEMSIEKPTKNKRKKRRKISINNESDVKLKECIIPLEKCSYINENRLNIKKNSDCLPTSTPRDQKPRLMVDMNDISPIILNGKKTTKFSLLENEKHSLNEKNSRQKLKYSPVKENLGELSESNVLNNHSSEENGILTNKNINDNGSNISELSVIDSSYNQVNFEMKKRSNCLKLTGVLPTNTNNQFLNVTPLNTNKNSKELLESPLLFDDSMNNRDISNKHNSLNKLKSVPSDVHISFDNFIEHKKSNNSDMNHKEKINADLLTSNVSSFYPHEWTNDYNSSYEYYTEDDKVKKVKSILSNNSEVRTDVETNLNPESKSVIETNISKAFEEQHDNNTFTHNTINNENNQTDMENHNSIVGTDKINKSDCDPNDNNIDKSIPIESITTRRGFKKKKDNIKNSIEQELHVSIGKVDDQEVLTFENSFDQNRINDKYNLKPLYVLITKLDDQNIKDSSFVSSKRSSKRTVRRKINKISKSVENTDHIAEDIKQIIHNKGTKKSITKAKSMPMSYKKNKKVANNVLTSDVDEYEEKDTVFKKPKYSLPDMKNKLSVPSQISVTCKSKKSIFSDLKNIMEMSGEEKSLEKENENNVFEEKNDSSEKNEQIGLVNEESVNNSLQNNLQNERNLNHEENINERITDDNDQRPSIHLTKDALKVTMRRNTFKKLNQSLEVINEDQVEQSLSIICEKDLNNSSTHTCDTQNSNLNEHSKENSLLHQNENDIFIKPRESQPIFLKPGKSWARSLSIINHFHTGQNLQELAIGRGKNWRQSVQTVLNMQSDGVPDTDQKNTNKKSDCLSLPQKESLEKGSQRISAICTSPTRFSRRFSIRIVPSGKRSTLTDDFLSLQKNSSITNRTRKTSLRDNRSSIIKTEDDLIRSAKDIILKRCKQTSYIPFNKCFPDTYTQYCRKIGEGVYGEVFLYEKDDIKSVIKIIPIEGDMLVNSEPQKKFHEILSEIIIAEELHKLKLGKFYNTDGFVSVNRIKCVIGKYPAKLIDLWNEYDEIKRSENDCPSMFDNDQLYIVLDLAHGGKDLEAYIFQNASESYSIFLQTAYSLAVAEKSLEFEHRDLHWGNILISKTDSTHSTFKLNEKEVSLQTKGVKVSVIDFTLSRMSYQNCKIFNDLSMDPALFTAQGEYQFDIYRMMRDNVNNDWQQFNPFTNILWLDYTLDKMITAVRYNSKKKTTKIHKNAINQMKELRKVIFNYKSAFDFISNCEKLII